MRAAANGNGAAATSGAVVPFTGSEREQSQLAALALLAKMEYRVLSREEALALRGGRASRVLLEDVLRAQLARINRIRFRGREVPFSGANIRRAIQALEDVPLAEGLQRANEQVYDLLRLGKSLEQTVERDTKSFSLRYVDWERPENNVFHATAEFLVQRAGSAETRRLDVVLFVNGIPFAVMECKAPDEPVAEGIRDIRAYQAPDFVPELFKYVQLVLATNRTEAKYATIGTEPKFWAVWKEAGADSAVPDLLRTPLPEPERELVLANFVRERPYFYSVERDGRQVTEQDLALYHLCRPERLLELAHGFIVYEGGEKKIARYQQYRAVKSAVRRLHRHMEGRERAGGVIWHSQGSGKSLTMVMLANAIAMDAAIERPRIVLVTDRIELDKQIAGTFHRCGLEPQRATSGADLRRLVQSPRANVITTLIQKFAAALRAGELADPSRNIFVLVDESHRTQYGTLHPRMRQVFPNACYIGFTGTPLTREEKNTVAKFGGLIDAYPMEQAVEDKAVVPLLYERRHVVQEVQDGAIDTWFDRYSLGLTPDQQKDLKRKYSAAAPVMKTEQRLRTTAFDVSAHFKANWQGTGYKAQLVAPDKKSAIQLRRFLNEIGWVSSEVIISPPDEREGVEEEEDPVAAEVRIFWQEMMDRHGSEERYNDDLIAGFSGTGDPETLIVVDKLLTGFDVPRNTVMYLARRLTGHTLLQAIGRVNRLEEGKDFGHILDYAGVLGELDRALNTYRALAGYDLEDLQGLLHDVRQQVDALPLRYAALLDVFRSVRNKADQAEYEELLADPERRDEFRQALTEFSKSLRVALSTEVFYQETPAETIERYRSELRRFQRLRAAVELRYSDVVDMRRIGPQIQKLLDTYVTSDSVENLTPEPVNIFDAMAMERALETLGTPAAQADAMAHALARTIHERMDEDPALYRKFSEMVRETIRAFREHLLGEMEYLKRIRELRDQVVRPGADVPPRLAGNDVALAYYRIVRERLDALCPSRCDPELPVQIAEMLERAIGSEVVVDWRHKPDVLNRMRANIDDGFFELSQQGKIALEWSAIDEIAGEALRVARSRLQ